MIRDNVFPAARWRIPPDNDEIAAQRVAELCSISLLGLTFTVYSSIGQLEKALEDGAGWRCYEEKMVADSGDWSRIWTIRTANRDKVIYKLWVWQTMHEVTVLLTQLEQGLNKQKAIEKLAKGDDGA